MSRRAAVAFFLGDAAFLSDAKFRDLARRLPHPDDFNAAVGAWFIALAQSRRNGTHIIDLEAETGTRFGAELRATGLITDEGFPSVSWKVWGAVSPQQAQAGLARASSAQRDEGGHFLPSGTSALDKLASAVQPSPPLPSNHLSTEEGGAGGRNGMEKLDGPLAYYELTGKYPGHGSALNDWTARLADEYGAAEFQKALATEYTIERNGRTLMSRTESRLARTEDQALSAEDAARSRAEATATLRRLQGEQARRERLLTQPARQLKELMPEVKLGKSS